MTDKNKQSSLFSKDEACLFCRIAKKEKDSYVIFEDTLSFAFLDSRPLFPGHILLIPKIHYGEIMEIPDETVGVLFSNVKALGAALEKGLNAGGCFIAVNNKIGQTQPHLHIHIVPRKLHDGLKGFFWPRYKYSSNEEMAEVQEKIVNALKR
jgi:histidine triad (HIT) family protein